MRDQQKFKTTNHPNYLPQSLQARARLWLRAINKGATGERVSALCNRLVQF